MKKGIITISIFLLFCFSAIGTIKASVLTFDDTSYQGSYVGNLDSNYGGFNWSSHFDVFYGPGLGAGYDAGTISGNYAAFNSYHHDVSLMSGDLFDWNGAWFNDPHNNGSDVLVEVKGFSEGVELYEEIITLSYATPILFQANWTGVDEISFDSERSWFTMDDFAYTQQMGAPIPNPEPTTVALLGIGLLVLASVSTRRKWRKEAVLVKVR